MAVSWHSNKASNYVSWLIIFHNSGVEIKRNVVHLLKRSSSCKKLLKVAFVYIALWSMYIYPCAIVYSENHYYIFMNQWSTPWICGKVSARSAEGRFPTAPYRRRKTFTCFSSVGPQLYGDRIIGVFRVRF